MSDQRRVPPWFGRVVGLGVLVAIVGSATPVRRAAGGDEAEDTQTYSWTKPEQCGVNALYLLGKSLDKSWSYAELQRVLHPTPGRGVSLQDLAAVAADHGLPCEVRKISRDELFDVPVPFLAHMEDPDAGVAGHFVVVHSATPDQVYFADGTTGQIHLVSSESASSKLSGFVLVPEAATAMRTRTQLPVVLLGAAAAVQSLIVVAMAWRLRLRAAS